ncbi:hypothetical protein APHAL10511_006273 [Amanita phalloides]|nr:hypothetical protein APHAL10511_006273 [Amanita phalloides]
MGFCRRCGEIVSGERCKCGGIALAPVVSWNDQDSENYDRWSKTYVTRDRSASTGASQVKRYTKGISTPSSTDLSARISSYMVAVASTDRIAPSLKSATTGPVPEAGILPSPHDSTLSKVYDATIYPDPRPHSAGENRFLCHSCFVRNGGSKGTCPACSRPVTMLKSEGSFIHAADQYWHKRCFNCNECQKNIGDTPLVDLLGRPSCSECFESFFRRARDREQQSTPTKSTRHSPVALRNIGGMDTTISTTKQNPGMNSRESSPALEELEQRLGVARNTREGSPSLEELSQKLSSIGKEPSRVRRDSRHSDRYKSPEPENSVSSSPERGSGLRYSTETPSPVRRHATEASRACSPAPTPEAIEEMKSRFMKLTMSSPSIPSSPLNRLAQSFTSFCVDEPRKEGAGYTTVENGIGSSILPSTMTLPAPDPISNTSGSVVQPSLPGVESTSCGSQRNAMLCTIDQDKSITQSDTDGITEESFGLDATVEATEEPDSMLIGPDLTQKKSMDAKPSKIPIARKSSSFKANTTTTAPVSMEKRAGNEPISIARCTKCEELLFARAGGKYLTLPAEDGAKPMMHHVECFRCTICEGTFKESGGGQAVFVKANGGPCHVECAPPEKHLIRKSTSMNSLRTNYVKSAVATSDNMIETSKTHKNLSPSSSRYESPSMGGIPRFGSRNTCPGCNIPVSPMERGVVPGPQGTRWHAACLICGGKKKKAITQQKSATWMIGRNGGDKKRNGEPGCGKKLDSAAKTDRDGEVWCRECLLLLGSLSPPATGTSEPPGIISQHTGTTIARQFTGTNDSGLLRQLTGGGLSPTRSISPTKQLNGTGTSGRPRPKSVIGIRNSKSVDEGRGMYLVRQMTGNSALS